MRVDQAVRAGQGQPLVRREIGPPRAEGRGQNVRAYSWAIVEFAP